MASPQHEHASHGSRGSKRKPQSTKRSKNGKPLQHFNLSGLPFELQRKILHFMLVRDDTALMIGWRGGSSKEDEEYDDGPLRICSQVSLDAAILRTCRTYHDEGMELLYGNNIFAFRASADGFSERVDCPGPLDKDNATTDVLLRFATPDEFARDLSLATIQRITSVYITEIHGEHLAPSRSPNEHPVRVLLNMCAYYRGIRNAVLGFAIPGNDACMMFSEWYYMLAKLPLDTIAMPFQVGEHDCFLERMVHEPNVIHRYGWKVKQVQRPLPAWFSGMTHPDYASGAAFRVFTKRLASRKASRKSKAGQSA